MRRGQASRCFLALALSRPSFLLPAPLSSSTAARPPVDRSLPPLTRFCGLPSLPQPGRTHNAPRHAGSLDRNRAPVPQRNAPSSSRRPHLPEHRRALPRRSGHTVLLRWHPTNRDCAAYELLELHFFRPGCHQLSVGRSSGHQPGNRRGGLRVGPVLLVDGTCHHGRRKG